MALNNIISFGSAKSVELKDEYKNAVQACRQVLLKNLPKVVEYLFEKMDDTLYRMADKATNNSQQTSYFDAMRELRIARESIENSFNTGIIKRYEQFWREGPGMNLTEEPVFSLTEDDFSLIDNEDLEESLAINNMIAKGESLFFRELYALDQRFSHMLNGAKVEDGSNPVSPTAIAYSFKDAISNTDIDLPVKLVIYKQFEQEVIAYLGGMYDQMNDLLGNAGIVPKLHRHAKRNPVSPAMRGASSNYQPDAQQPDYDPTNLPITDADVQAELFSTLQNLLNMRRGQPAGAQRQSVSVPVFEAAQVLNALTSLQHTQPLDQTIRSGATLYDIRTGLETTLKAVESKDDKHRIDQVDEDAIDVISMLFEFILEDRNLHEAMKAQLACLQIPMLKVAILDKRFFSNKGHPARRLLNNLAQAAVGWTEANGREEDGVFDRVSKIVRRIVDEFESDLSLFEELNDQFSAFLETEKKSAKIAENRATQVTQGKEQLNQAKQMVFDEINQRLAQHRQIPEVVRGFLREGWKDVMLLVSLKSGTDSPEWKNALLLADDLIWSVEPKADYADRQKLLKLIPSLLKGLRQGLNNISYNQHQLTSLFKELQTYHVRCLRGVSAETAPIIGTDPVTPPTSVNKSASTSSAEEGEPASGKSQLVGEEIVLESVEPTEEETPKVADAYDEQARTLKSGSWLEMTQEDGEKYRAKLSWRSNVTGACLFVNRKGLKVAEFTPDGLAMLLREGKATILGEVDKPLMDRALDAMVSALRKTSGEASPSA
ncbi:MAG: DUF1631 domain-containing protein [Sedimenticola sp.]|nr:MAG: DUF1631 domain-containing protein [Sedimenticola sp.]